MYSRLCAAIKPDEQFCLTCLKSLDDETSFSRMFLAADVLCGDCRQQWIEHKRIYKVDNILYHVLYEYDETLESLFFQYKEQRDIVLAPAFLLPYKEKLKKAMASYCVCGLCSSDLKYLERGFHPLQEIFSSLNIPVFFPLYKIKEHKQSMLSKEARKKVDKIIFCKKSYPLPDKKIILVDDVCTTGASLKRACALLKPEHVFVICAHSLWIQANKENEQVEKKRFFW